MLQLKNGQTTEDHRLDRIEQFDERSRGYGIVPHLQSLGRTALRSYTWMGGPVTDQGREGACVGHGWTSELTARPRPVTLVDPTAHAHQLYLEAQTRDEYPGEAYSGTSVLAGAQILQDRGWMTEFRWAFGIDEVLLALGRQGPVVLGIPWYESMYTPSSGVVTVSGQKVGGHCILARGVNMRNRTVLLRNSWGSDWGVAGDARISVADLSTLLQDGGEACVPVGRTAKAA